MRVINALLALCFVALGVVFGALNREHVSVDLGVAAFNVRLGLLLLMVALIGSLLGGLAVMAGVVWPMRRRARSQGPRPAAERHSGPVTAEMPAFREPPK